jgi:hypothetical protein
VTAVHRSLSCLLAAMLSTSCASVEPGSESLSTTSIDAVNWDEADPAQLAVTTREDHFGFQAGVVGRLQLRDGCFYVTRPNHGAEALVPVFPRSSVAESGDHFTYQGHRYGSGDRIRLSGGLVELVQDESVQVPPACDSSTAYWFVGPR